MRKLNPFKVKIKQKFIMGLDTEDNSKGFVLWVNFFDGERHYSFDNNLDAIDWLYGFAKKRGEAIYIFCTQLEYDIVSLFQHLWKLVTVEFFSNRLIKANMEGVNVTFYDTLNHYKGSVKELGKLIGLPKLDFAPSDLEYCKRDTEITYRFAVMLQGFYNDLKVNLKSTIGGESLELFRSRFLKCSMIKPEEEDIEDFRSAYYGGRVEVYDMNEVESLTVLDINSLYSSVMKSNLFPFPEYYIKEDRFKPNGVYFAEVESGIKLPVLPWRNKYGKVFFPNGRFYGWWTYPELSYAQSQGVEILRVIRGYRWLYEFDWFTEYVSYLWGKRQESKDKFENKMFKILLNSLYGKFAMGREKTVLKDGIFKTELLDPSPSSNYILSIWVTSFARICLHKKIKEFQSKGCYVVYTDTDSIIYQGDYIEDSKELGRFKLVGKFDRGKFLLPKLYWLERDGKKIVKAKGIPQKSKLDFISEGVAEYLKPCKLRESVRLRKHPNVWYKAEKIMREEYDKRYINKDGSTNPVQIYEAI